MTAEPANRSREWTLGQLLEWTRDYLARNGVSDPRLSAEVLLAHAAECRRIDLYTRFERILNGPRIDQFREWVRRAGRHEPIAYLVGEKEFFSLLFHVSREVLIPRPETEVLVECALKRCREIVEAHPTILDVGTGTGCIPISVLTHAADARVVASDISAAALELARTNMIRHGVADRMTLVVADRLDIPSEVVPARGFDLIVSNPPYVPAADYQKLAETVRHFEPPSSITDGDDGLSFYRSLVQSAGPLLADNGIVLVEIADGAADSVLKTFAQTGEWEHRETVKDRTVGQARVLTFSRQGRR